MITQRGVRLYNQERAKNCAHYFGSSAMTTTTRFRIQDFRFQTTHNAHVRTHCLFGNSEVLFLTRTKGLKAEPEGEIG